jgi:hypothetical protein
VDRKKCLGDLRVHDTRTQAHQDSSPSCILSGVWSRKFSPSCALGFRHVQPATGSERDPAGQCGTRDMIGVLPPQKCLAPYVRLVQPNTFCRSRLKRDIASSSSFLWISLGRAHSLETYLAPKSNVANPMMACPHCPHGERIL